MVTQVNAIDSTRNGNMDPNFPLGQGQSPLVPEPTALEDASSRVTASDVAEGAGTVLDLASGAVEVLGGILDVIGGLGDL